MIKRLLMIFVIAFVMCYLCVSVLIGGYALIRTGNPLIAILMVFLWPILVTIVRMNP